ncbi:MAG TPA: hypothetical protein VFS59_17470 [Gemmatimonadaceae bacterium]|nr:hypothetical protein [Gemmatimonadaceae bacterium]
MHPIVRSTFVALATMTAVTFAPTRLSAQGAKVDPCSLLSVAQVNQATGKTNYGAGERGEPGDGVGGGDPCNYDASGPARAPTVSVIVIPPKSTGRYHDWLKKQKATPGCTRSAVPGLGVDAFTEECARYSSLPLYMRGKSYDVVVGIQMSRAGDFAANRPAVIALARAVAPKIR